MFLQAYNQYNCLRQAGPFHNKLAHFKTGLATHFKTGCMVPAFQNRLAHFKTCWPIPKQASCHGLFQKGLN